MCNLIYAAYERCFFTKIYLFKSIHKFNKSSYVVNWHGIINGGFLCKLFRPIRRSQYSQWYLFLENLMGLLKIGVKFRFVKIKHDKALEY